MKYTTSELASLCGVSARSISKWADNNGVLKDGRFWNFTESDYQRLFEYYNVSEPGSEPTEPSSEPKEPASEPNELIEELRKQNEYLREQIAIKDSQIDNLIEINKANAVIIAKYSALPEPDQETEEKEEEPSSEPAEPVEEPRKWWQFWK